MLTTDSDVSMFPLTFVDPSVDSMLAIISAAQTPGSPSTVLFGSNTALPSLDARAVELSRAADSLARALSKFEALPGVRFDHNAAKQAIVAHAIMLLMSPG